MSHIGREFTKLLFQKRTYFGWAGVFVVPFLITVAIRFSHEAGRQPAGSNQQDPGFFFNLIGSNGLYVAVGALFALMTFLLPLIASMAGSQTIAGEAERGTLRTVLMQPVRRGAVLLAKWLVANFYVGICLIVLAAGSFIAGGSIYGLKPAILLTGQVVSVGKALLLILMAYAYVLVAMAAVVSVAVLLSAVTDSGLAAMAAGLALIIVMLILGNLSVFAFLKPYLITSHFDAAMQFFRSPIDWAPIRNGLINFAVWIVGMTGIAWLIFRRKDILS